MCAQTVITSTSHPALVRSAYARKAWLWAQPNMFFAKFISTQVSDYSVDGRTGGQGKRGVDISNGTGSIITLKTEPKLKKRDTVDIRVLAPLTGAGKADSQRLKDNEEALSYYTFSPTVHLRRHAVAVDDINEFRTEMSIREDAKVALGNWLAQTMDSDTLLALSGLPNSVATLTRNAPSTNRIWRGGQTTAGVVEAVATELLIDSATTNLFGTQVITWVKRKAQLGGSGYPKIRPIMVKGKPYYVMFVHPLQMKSLKGEAAWIAAQQYANVRGEDNPIFNGAEGVWDGVIIHEWEKIETRLGAGGTTASEWFDVSTDANASGITTARALFCGAQAGVHAIGRNIRWIEDKDDYENIMGTSLNIIMCAEKTEFNSEDFGTIAVDTAVVLDS